MQQRNKARERHSLKGRADEGTGGVARTETLGHSNGASKSNEEEAKRAKGNAKTQNPEMDKERQEKPRK